MALGKAEILGGTSGASGRRQKVIPYDPELLASWG
jgi:hypothetical protein